MKLKQKLQEGKQPVGGWCSLPSPGVAEVLATAEFDFVTVDTEHAPTSTESVEHAVRAIEAAPGETAPLIRIGTIDHARIKRVLDTGPAGVMAPQVNTAADARELVRGCRYPRQQRGPSSPSEHTTDESTSDDRSDDVCRGRRGVAASRASNYGRRLDEYVRNAAESLAVIAQIETPEAVKNAGNIASVPGIDALFVGPADLSASLGRFREFDDPAFADAVEKTVTAGNDAGVPVGTLATTDERIDAWLDAGFDFLIVGTDIGFLGAGADRAIERYQRKL